MTQLTPNALTTLQQRYFIKNKDGEIVENFEDLCRRVAKHVASCEKPEYREEWEERYYSIMNDLCFLPNTPTLMNAGKPNGQLAACFVLGVEDTMESIMDTAKNSALIHKSGGGTGFDFSRLRAKNSIVATTSGTASGPVSFMDMYNGITEKIKQGGTRRGANMGILRVDHPDIMEFITFKQDLSKLTNFNISVAITDVFMQAVRDNKEYDLIEPNTNKVSGQLKAKEVFDKIVDCAWETGEPGLFFIDVTNKLNGYGVIRATNPCGEQPLRDNESCNLGSINLAKYVNYKKFDWDLYIEDITIATRMLDSIIEVNHYPLEIIKNTHAETRKIGLGVMGYAEALILMGIEYGSEEAEKFADKCYSMMSKVSKATSVELAIEKGKCLACDDWKNPRRNYWTTTIAPTGTISIIAGCSSGIEPIFAVAYERNILDGMKLTEFNPIFRQMMEEAGVEITKAMEQELITNSSIQKIKGIPNEIKKLFKTASDVTVEQHIRTQSIFQKYSDSGISKTINMDETATKKDVAKAYMLAYDLGCKGVTVYRNNSRANQPMSNKIEEPKRKTYNRTTRMNGFTEKVKTNLGNMYLTINEHAQGEPGEVLITIGKSGADISGLGECIARLASVGLQWGIPPHKIAEQLIGIKGEANIIHENSKFLSIPDLIGRRLDDSAKEKTKKKETTLEKCPMCESALYNAEGCKTCMCGYSKC